MEDHGKSVAIIGVSGVFPEADSIEQFYHNLKSGRDSIREVSVNRLHDSSFDPYAHYLPMGYMDSVDGFDHKFFNLSKREADLMNPEQRLILQLSCRAIENAGYRLQSFQGSNTAVYLGGGNASNYASLIQEFEPTALTGNMNAVTAGRVAYFLNLNGPALMIDTSCSSALVAIYEACQKVVGGQVDYALAGGVYTIIHFPDISEATGEIGIMSEDGRSKSFASGANGTGGGEGGGVVLLKRLDKALADKDLIHAVIRGGAINHDGSRSAGLTAPSVKAQTEVIKQAWQNAGVLPETISFVEAHGTGTKLGDPIEFEALTEAFRQFTEKKKICALGSVKTNVGHLNNAAGLAGVVKSVLSLKHQELFPSLHYHKPNPFIDVENTALQVNTHLKKWERKETLLRCGVSSFGLSGTNAHLILEEAPAQPSLVNTPIEKDFILKISAKTPESLRLYITRISNCLAGSKENLSDVLYTLNHGRDEYAYRLCLAAASQEQLQQALASRYTTFDTHTYGPIREDQKVGTVLLFSDDSAEEKTIEQLSLHYPLFQQNFEHVISLGQKQSASLRTFAFQYALYRQWQKIGIQAKTIIGTGTGRFTKQVIVDGLALEQAVVNLEQTEAENAAVKPSATPDEEKLKKAVKTLEQTGKTVFLEMGAGGILSRSIEGLLEKTEGSSVSALIAQDFGGSLLGKVADLYQQGVFIDWNIFYAQTHLRRVEVPTYPFENIRCWVENHQRPTPAKTSVEDWLYNLCWEKTESPQANAGALTNGTFVVIMDGIGLGEKLVRQLKERGNQCVQVQLGGEYVQHAEGVYTINAGLESDYSRLEEELAAKVGHIDGLIHLGTYAAAGSLSSDSLDSQLERGVLSQFYLLRAFQRYLKRNFYVAFITAQAYSILEGEASIVPTHSVSAGLLKGLMAEYPLLKVSQLDFEFSRERLEQIVAHILVELTSESLIRFIAYRHNNRYVQQLSRIAASERPDSTIKLVSNGVYIITGGISGIGLEVARKLAQREKMHLIILGRTNLPAREDWKGIHPAINENDITRKVAHLLELEALGAEVDYYSLDLGHLPAVKEVFSAIGKKVGKVHGILHSAGVPGNWEPLYRKKTSDFKDTLLPKVQGTVYLDECSQFLSPDFFISFSSLNAVVAQKNSADYAVANAFLDAYAVGRNGHQRFLSINWPGWYETGMSLQKKTAVGANKDPLQPISTKDGLRALDLVLAIPSPNVLVANVNLAAFYVNPYFLIAEAHPNNRLTPTGSSNRPGDMQIDERATPTERTIIRIWQEVLRANSIRLEDDFFDIGGHSLNGAQVIHRIEKELGVKVEIDDLFENGTVLALAGLIDQRQSSGQTTTYSDIQPIDKQSYYLVSHAQRRLWVLHQFTDNKIAYNISNVFVFKGLKREAFSLAFDTLVERHESLRTTFLAIDGQPYQEIHDSSTFGLQLGYVDLRDQPNQEEQLKAFIHQEAQTSFDLEKGPLVRVKLIQLEGDTYAFIYVMHHIISDGWSMEVIQQELFKLYHAYMSGLPNPLSPLRIQYKDYAAWHNAQLSGTALAEHQTYWLKQFQGEIPVLNLPTDFPRPSIKSFQGAIKRVALGRPLSEGLQHFSQQKGVSLFMTLQALLKALMYRYTGQEDIVMGSVEAGRNHQSLENQIGYYINTLALRTRFRGTSSFDELLRAVKETTLAAFEHNLYPFDSLVKELGVDRDMSRTPLFDISMSLQNLNVVDIHPGGLEAVDVSNFEIDITISKNDVNFVFILVEEGLLVQVEYCTDLFTSDRIQRLIGHLQGLMQAVLTDSTRPLFQLDYLSEVEKQQLIFGFNQTDQPYPEHLTMHEVFENIVRQYPQQTALVFQEQTLTYQQLNEAANQLAHHLRENYFIVPDEAIGLMVHRSERLLIGILGILKAGGAYLPIDPDYPQDRKAFLLADAHVQVLLTEMDWLFSVPAFEGELFALDVQLPTLTTPTTNPVRLVTPDNLAYLIYTSGSTGRPKGVMVEHRGNVNMALDQIQRFGIGLSDKVLQFASCSFDASVYEIGLALYAGATLVLLDKALIQAPEALVDYLQATGVTVATLPPVYLASLNKARLGFLRVIITAGEAANVSDAVACSRFCQYYNAYGPTEASVCVSTYQVTEADQGKMSIPIGFPLNNTRLYLLDAHGALVPVGVEGEICIGGVGLARGYVSNTALTDLHFKEHPQLQMRYYRTGDIGKRLSSGAIEFMGRRDSQLKVRGYRIEGGEIVSVLTGQEGVQDAYILPRGSVATGQTLTAIIVPDPSISLAGLASPEARAWLASIKEGCQSALPAYMVPSAFRLLAELPLTAHGKVDKDALLKLDETFIDEEHIYRAPSSTLEKQLVRIWEAVLAHSPIGIRDNFFELGGHSLKATQVVSRIHREMGAKIELGSIFNRPTIEELAEWILKSGVDTLFKSIPVAASKESYPLSYAQRRLWILNQFEENRLAYVIPTAYLLEGILEKGAFEQAFQTIVERYDILRTTFSLEEGGPQQRVHSYASFGLQLEIQEMHGKENLEIAAQALSEQESNTPFDLEKGPLVRAKLLQLAEDRHLFLLTLHHIITDGWSIELLTNEMFSLYNAFLQHEENPLPELPIQYKDYSVWQHEQLQGENLQKQQAYWLTRFGGTLPVLELPSDKKRPEIKTYHGDRVELVLEETLVERLKTISQEQEASLFMSLLASVYAFLNRYSGLKDMILGTTLAGRPHQDLENQVGFFINTLAFRNEIQETDTFSSLLERVRENTLAAFEHQEYPFDRLVDDLGLVRDVSRHPLFDVSVELDNLDIYQSQRQEMKGISITPFHADSLISKFDLSFRFAEQSGNTLGLSLEFNTDVYSKIWIERMLAHYSRLLEKLVNSPSLPVHSLPYLSEPEISRLLVSFNLTSADYPTKKTILDLFAEQVNRTPNAVALVFEEQEWSYRQLDEQSNQLAHLLRLNYGVQAEDLIGMMVVRSAEMMVVLLGILKAGAAYVPIDAELPSERIRYLLEDSQVKWLITDQDVESIAPASIRVSQLQQQMLEYSPEATTWEVKPNQLAYVIYTSGSTGLPKGVQVEHQSLVNLSVWLSELIYRPHSHPLTALLTASINFDASVQQLFAPLLNGSKLVIIPESTRRDPQAYCDALLTYQVEVIDITPSFLGPVLSVAKNRSESLSLRYTLVGGEALPEEVCSEYSSILGEESQLINVYGITEATVNSTYERVDSRRASGNSIGKPLSNTQLYVLDPQQQLVPVGITGEIYIGGLGVSRGYLNREALTQERFIANPFVSGERLYRTGDLGRWLLDGSLEYLGRTDFQVKIRGFRIETGEVESVLLQHPAIQEGIVMARKNADGDAYLTAYFTSEQEPVETDLRVWLGSRLPHYMIPSFFRQLPTIPLNISGKVDRNALPNPEVAGALDHHEYVAPGNEIEEMLVKLWEELLEQKPIGVRDHFFQMGGNSLAAARFFRKVNGLLPGTVRMSDLFIYDTVEALAVHINSQAPRVETAEVADSGKKLKKITI